MGCCCSSEKKEKDGSQEEVPELDEKDDQSNQESKKSAPRKKSSTKLNKNATSLTTNEKSIAALKGSFPTKPPTENKPVYFVALWDYEAASKAEVTVRAGDRLRQMADHGGDAGTEWIFATLIGEDRCGTGYIPRSFVALEGSLEAERWYFGKIPRREAENYLRDTKAATFLVRKRDEETSRRRDNKRASAEYTLSVKKEDGKIRHYQVWRLSPSYGDGYFLTKRMKFCSVVDLIEFYKRDRPEDDHDQCRLVEPPRKPMPRRIELSVEAQKNWREIPRTQIKVFKEVGRGNFGLVFEGTWQSGEGTSPQRVAIKVLKKGSMRAKQQFLQEAIAMKNLSHRRLVSLYGVVCSAEPFWLITEFVKDGSLRNYLRARHNKNQPLSERSLVEICAQVAEGMRYLEEKRVVHRDLAARNVLIEERGNGLNAPHIETKIADFGLAKLLQEAEPALQAQKKYRDIPVKWTAPEALKDAIYSSQSDVWSYGILVHEVFTHGQEPYPILVANGVRDYVVVKRQILQKHESVPMRVYELMAKCFRYYPLERPKFKEIYLFFDHFYRDFDKSSSIKSASTVTSANKSSPIKGKAPKTYPPSKSEQKSKKP